MVSSAVLSSEVLVSLGVFASLGVSVSSSFTGLFSVTTFVRAFDESVTCCWQPSVKQMIPTSSAGSKVVRLTVFILVPVGSVFGLIVG